jgi:hypothetical protein
MSVNNNLQTGSGRIRVARFTASGSWVAPAGVFSVQALAVGGGGGGGAARSATSTNLTHGGGGGGGGVFDELLAVVPGTTYTVTIGTGGAGANTTTAAGANGTDTTFGSIMTAPGGQGGSTLDTGTSTAVRSTSNPGGSMGGFASNGTASGSGPGNGAASSIIATFTTATGHTVFAMQVQNGYGVVTIPSVSHNAASGSNAAQIYYPATSATTAYARIRRHESPFGAMSLMTQFLPGLPWKGLGSGGATVLSANFADYTGFENSAFIHPSAGRISYGHAPLVSTTSSALFNGTNGVANTGAGGGGSCAAHSNTGIATGGNGGSGYLEVTWQE